MSFSFITLRIDRKLIPYLKVISKVGILIDDIILISFSIINSVSLLSSWSITNKPTEPIF